MPDCPHPRYIVGAIDILIGVIIFLILTLLLSDRYFAYRATRLPSTIFVFFGAAQMYSAYRGFCSQVWGRASSQLRPWELDMGDEEDLVGSRSSTPPSAPTSMSQQPSEMVETNRSRRIGRDGRRLGLPAGIRTAWRARLYARRTG